MVTGTARTLTATAGLLVALQLAGAGRAGSLAAAPAQRPTIDVTPSPALVRAAAGTSVTLRLAVRLPSDIHVQSNKPRDPSLIPTALTLTPQAGLSIDKVVFPKAIDLPQADRAEPLAVFGGDFTVDARLSVAADMAPGDHAVAATLRYQACNASVCFAPARATVQWTLTVAPAPEPQLSKDIPSESRRARPR
jgi:hypothetical protein